MMKESIDSRICPICNDYLSVNEYNGELKHWDNLKLTLICCSCSDLFRSLQNDDFEQCVIEWNEIILNYNFSLVNNNKKHFQYYIEIEGFNIMKALGLLDNKKVVIKNVHDYNKIIIK